MTLENARLALKKRKLDFEEHTYDSQQVVLLPWGHVKITIIPGDRLVQTRTPVYAHGGCACEHDLFLTLAFGPDGGLKQDYVDREPVCL